MTEDEHRIATLQERVDVLRAMLEATENQLAPPDHDENAESLRARHAVALTNARQITQMALSLERDLADGVANAIFLNAILMRYRPDHRPIPGPKTFEV